MGQLDSTRGKCLQEEKKKPSHKSELQKFSSFPVYVTVKKIMPFVSKLQREKSNSYDKCTGVKSSTSIKMN